MIQSAASLLSNLKFFQSVYIRFIKFKISPQKSFFFFFLEKTRNANGDQWMIRNHFSFSQNSFFAFRISSPIFGLSGFSTMGFFVCIRLLSLTIHYARWHGKKPDDSLLTLIKVSLHMFTKNNWFFLSVFMICGKMRFNKNSKYSLLIHKKSYSLSEFDSTQYLWVLHQFQA